MRTTMQTAVLLSSVFALGALILVSAGLAGQPVTQTLNPPPPAWQTCKTVGEGTICEGTLSFVRSWSIQGSHAAAARAH